MNDCRYCGERPETLELLIDHVHKAHPDKSTIGLEVALKAKFCKYCGERFENPVKQSLHVKFQHPREWAIAMKDYDPLKDLPYEDPYPWRES